MFHLAGPKGEIKLDRSGHWHRDIVVRSLEINREHHDHHHCDHHHQCEVVLHCDHNYQVDHNYHHFHNQPMPKNLAGKNGVEVRSLKRTKLEMVGNTVERVRLEGTVHQPDDGGDDYDDGDGDDDDHHYLYQPDDGGDELMMVMMMIDGNGSSLLMMS